MRINYLDPNAGKTVTNGASVANVVEQGDSQEAVSVNGAIGKTYKGVVNIQFSPDGKRVAYNAITQDNKPVVVLDGKELQGYSPLRPFAFSPDSQHFAYWSGPTMSKYPWQQIGDDTPSFLGKSYVVVDDKKGELFDDMHDGNYEAFSYMPGNPLMPMQNTIEFTSDGKYVRYNERKGDSILLITQPVDGVI
jgi:roadblock/LC7 domain-containing protein